MSRTRRNFSAKFKSELVIELLKGEKDLNTIASENNIQPNLLRNWKKEFLDKASVVFDDTREDTLCLGSYKFVSEISGGLVPTMDISPPDVKVETTFFQRKFFITELCNYPQKTTQKKNLRFLRSPYFTPFL